MNKVILMGRLTADPEMRQTPNGIAVTRFSIAVNRKFAKEGQQKADFINCVAWRNTAEFIQKYFQKGNMIAIVGSIQTNSWDGTDGKKHYSTDVLVDEADFTGSKNDSQSSSQQPTQQNNSFGGSFDAFPTTSVSDDDNDLPF